ncbi:MAG: sterol desaturase family protein [Saprospiraceae bacterium]|nr:sterol desaturase family protein [Saprospiraceae bacterium]
MAKKRLFVNLEDKSVRMFSNDFLDSFSRVHWTVPLYIYIPVIGFSAYATAAYTSMVWYMAIVWFLAGIIFWTFAEYVLHRFVFHYHPTTEFGKRIHFMTHGVHHDYPRDSMRLVMPPSVSVPLAFLFFFGFRFALGAEIGWPFFGGFVIGYLAYDMIHYATHHANVNWGWFNKLKKHHMDHHYKEPDLGFGVTNTVWDVLFFTPIDKEEKKKKAVEK